MVLDDPSQLYDIGVFICQKVVGSPNEQMIDEE